MTEDLMNILQLTSDLEESTKVMVQSQEVFTMILDHNTEEKQNTTGVTKPCQAIHTEPRENQSFTSLSNTTEIIINLVMMTIMNIYTENILNIDQIKIKM